MAQTGLQLRRDTKENLLLTSTRVGEIVYAEDTEEIGMYLNGTMEWSKIGESGGGPKMVTRNTYTTNSNYYDNECYMFDIDLTQPKAIRYQATINDGIGESTSNGLFIIPSSANMPVLAAGYANSTGINLKNFLGTREGLQTEGFPENFEWRIQEIGSGIYKLYLKPNDASSNKTISMVYDEIVSTEDRTSFLSYS